VIATTLWAHWLHPWRRRKHQCFEYFVGAD
jgi:hypothetical protein